MLQALIAGAVLIIIGVITGQSPLWVIGIAVLAGGLIRWFFISGRDRKH
jgi:Flp pilus assembly protein TadB